MKEQVAERLHHAESCLVEHYPGKSTSNIGKSTSNIRKHSSKKYKSHVIEMFTCEVCKSCSFGSFDETNAHEIQGRQLLNYAKQKSDKKTSPVCLKLTPVT